MVVAFIPARGGSKRLPGKNLRAFAGRPLIAYSIALARRVRGIDRVLVSTDDAAIADVARQWEAEVVRRPAELATDAATTAAAAQHALQHLVGLGESPGILITLQPTNPLRPDGLVEEGLALFQRRRPDSVVAVARTEAKTGRVLDGMYQPEYRPGTRSQDLEERYRETGQLYVTDARLVLERCDLFGSRIAALPTEPLFAADIDTAEDFELAELVYLRHRDRFPSFPVQAALATAESGRG